MFIVLTEAEKLAESTEYVEPVNVLKLDVGVTELVHTFKLPVNVLKLNKLASVLAV